MNWDLIEHFQLDAQVHDDHTVHTEYVSDPARGVRMARVEKRWYKHRHIGHGAFGDVWLEVHKERDQVTAERAVKIIQKRRIESVQIDYKRELLALAKLSRNQALFVTLLGWYENSDSVFLAMEYFPNGDLENYIARGIAEDEAKLICAQLLDGLRLMHSREFTHRDLKPQNIFVVSPGPQWWVKIGDFGISKRISSEQTALRTQAGTQQFQAPEILGFVEEAEETSEYTNAVDMWSLGCVSYLMLSQTIPFARLRALNEYCSGRVQFPSNKLHDRDVSLDGVRFVEELLNPHPSERPTAEQASQHSWLQLAISAEVQKGVDTLEVQVGALGLNPTHHQPQTHASSSNDSPSTSLTSIQTTIPATVQRERIVDFTTRTDTSTLTSLQPSLTTTIRPDGERNHELLHHRGAGYSTTDDVQEGSRLIRERQYCLMKLQYEDVVYCVAFSPDGRIIAAGSRDGSATVWDTIMGKQLWVIPGNPSSVWKIAFSPDGTTVAAGLSESIRIWDVTTGQLVRKLKPDYGAVSCIAFSPDGRTIASGMRENSVVIWDIATKKQLQELQGHEGTVTSVAFSPDGTAIVSVSEDRFGKIWDTVTGRWLRELEGHSGDVWSVAFSPDGSAIVSGSEDRSVRIWDAATGMQLRELEGHSDPVWGVTFSPDGRIIASSASDRSVRLWDGTTGTQLRKLEGHTGIVSCVAFSPDGTALVSGSFDGTVRMWEASV